MPIDAFIHLDRLRCISEFDGSGHSEPYAWVMLLSDALAEPPVAVHALHALLERVEQVVHGSSRSWQRAVVCGASRMGSPVFQGVGARQGL
jgi:hypothetical protein